MSSGIYTTRTDVPYKAAGPGSLMTWLCLGCNKPKLMDGSKGRGVYKRCASCLAPKVVTT